MASANKVLFRLTSESLIVANTGSSFSRTGVISICTSHLSNKLFLQPLDDWQGTQDHYFVQALQDHHLKTYRHDRNLIFEDFNREQALSRDYSGRALWELLQNADDAMAPDVKATETLIGSKGLGFKSILELTEEPEIHSGAFGFPILREKITAALGRDPGGRGATTRSHVSHTASHGRRR